MELQTLSLIPRENKIRFLRENSKKLDSDDLAILDLIEGVKKNE